MMSGTRTTKTSCASVGAARVCDLEEPPSVDGIKQTETPGKAAAILLAMQGRVIHPQIIRLYLLKATTKTCAQTESALQCEGLLRGFVFALQSSL